VALCALRASVVKLFGYRRIGGVQNRTTRCRLAV